MSAATGTAGSILRTFAGGGSGGGSGGDADNADIAEDNSAVSCGTAAVNSLASLILAPWLEFGMDPT